MKLLITINLIIFNHESLAKKCKILKSNNFGLYIKWNKKYSNTLIIISVERSFGMVYFIYKICFRSLSALALLGITLFFLSPTIASSQFGKKKIETYYSEKINGSVSFKNLNFTFWGHQKIEGMEVKDKDGNFAFNASLISVESSFPNILFSEILENQIIFSNANLTIGTANDPIDLKNMNGNLSLASENFTFKLTGLSSLNGSEGAFDFDISLKGIESKNRLELLKTPDLLFSDSSKLKVDVKAKSFPIALIDFIFKTQNPEYKEDLLVSAFGEKLDLTLSKSKTDESKNLNLELIAVAGNLSANFVGEVGLDKIFTTKPSTLVFGVNQELIEQFYPETLSLKLAKPTTVFISIEEFSLPLDLKTGKCDLLDLMFKGRADLDSATLVSNIGLPNIELKKFTTAIHTDQSSDEFALKVQGNASQHGHPINVTLETTLPKSFNLAKHKFPPLKIDLKHIPLEIVDHFFNLDTILSKEIGTHADLKMEAKLEKDYLDLQFKFDSEKLTIPSMRVKIDDNITLIEPPTLYYKMSEELANKLLPKSAVVKLNTDKPLAITFHVNPILNFDDISHLTSNLSGSMNIHDVTFDSKERLQSVSFQELIIPWEISPENKEINFKFSGKTKYLSERKGGVFSGKASLKDEQEFHSFDVLLDQKNGDGHESQLRFNGNVANLFTRDGTLNTEGLTLNLDGTVKDLPTPLFCKVGCLNSYVHKKIEVLFGDYLSAEVHVALKQELNGLIQAKVTGNEGSFHIDSTIKDGFLLLNQPFEAHFKATARLGISILHDIFPVLSGIVSSDQPISITIPNKGFAFPLKRLDVSKIEIPQAILSLGHVKFDKSGELAKVLSLLTPSDEDLISVWFTPLYFTMHEGVFKLERVDMLISRRFPIATWGKVDLVQDKVKMTIGMSGYALKHAYKVKGLDNEYMVQIPLNGTTKSATIDKANATTKIGALVAQGHGGTKGLVLGTVLSLAGGALTEEKPPKSTTLPLPWAEELRENLIVAEDPPSTNNEEEIADVSNDTSEESLFVEAKSLNAVSAKKKSKKFKINDVLESEILDLFKPRS